MATQSVIEIMSCDIEVFLKRRTELRGVKLGEDAIELGNSLVCV